eukprot:scaffold1906_cov59-Phaeocystis_antarctica.AAC.2
MSPRRKRTHVSAVIVSVGLCCPLTRRSSGPGGFVSLKGSACASQRRSVQFLQARPPTTLEHFSTSWQL